MNLKKTQVMYNNTTMNAWDKWQGFRDMNRDFAYLPAIEHNKIPCKRALILGAGNGNDIDIPFFEERFQEIYIVDIDDQALQRFLAKTTRQEKFFPRIVDLSGLESVIDPIHELSPDEIIALMRSAEPTHDFSNIPGKFDFVLSSNFTSQLILPFITESFKLRDLIVTEDFNEVAYDLTSKVIDGLFKEVALLMEDGGVFLHSTDMFEISEDSELKTYSEGFKPIYIDLLKGDMRNISELLNQENVTKVEDYIVIGNYLPDVQGTMKEQSIKFIPWRFLVTDTKIRYYICRVLEYSRLA
jgi:hypothetical protein